MEDLQNLFIQKINSILPQSCGDKIVVAVSGGADSMALVRLAKIWADKYNKQIIGLTVDHQLRSESFGETKKVLKWLENIDVKAHILTWEGSKPNANIELVAREARYNLLFDFCKKNNIKTILLAHQKDEQAETFLLRLARGSGVYGLSAMKEVNYRQNIALVRPLLDFSKKQLINYNKSVNQEWVEDSSNQNEAFERVKIRKFLPKLKDISIFLDTLTKTASRMQRAAEALEFYAQALIKENVVFYDEGYAKVNWDKILNAPEEISLKTIANLTQILGGNIYPPRFERLFRLYKALQAFDFKGATLCGCLFKQDIICREVSKINDEIPITFQTKIIWDNRFSIYSKEKNNFIIKKIKTKDLNRIKELRLPFEVKKSIPCVYDNNFFVGLACNDLIFSDKKLNIKSIFIKNRGEGFE